MCCDAKTGDFKWGFGMQQRYGLPQIPDWHASQSAIIDNGVAVMAVVGTNTLMVGINCATGETEWETPSIPGWKMSHSTITPGVIAGKRQYLYAAVGGVVGVSAEPEDRGKILWTAKEWSPNVVAPSPVIITGNRFYMTAGYAGGGCVYEINRDGDTFSAKLVRKFRPNKGLSCEQMTPVLLDGRLYSVMPKDAGGYRNQFACADLEANILWSSGPTAQFGIGPFFYADGKFWIMNDDGVLTVGTVTDNQWTQLAKAKVLPGVDSWGPFALAGTRMIVRDNKLMVCLDLSTTATTAAAPTKEGGS
jgi:outer membrane protein assembly factor BamB